MSTREDLLNKALTKASVDVAVVNDPVSGVVTPPSTPVPDKTRTGEDINQPSSSEQSSQGIAGTIADTAREVLYNDKGGILPTVKRGAAAAVNETAKAFDQFATWAHDKTEALLGPTQEMVDSQGYPYNSNNWMVPGPKRAELAEKQKEQGKQPIISPDASIMGVNLNPSTAPKTFVGRTTESITQFAVGMLLAGKITKALGVSSQLGVLAPKVGPILNIVNGGIAQFISQDPDAKRLSNLLGDNFPATQAFTQYLAANPNDTAMEARFRSSIEGMGLGATTDMLFASAKYIKLDRLWKNAAGPAKDAASVLRDKALKSLDDIVEKGKAKAAQAPKSPAAGAPTTNPVMQRFQPVKNADGTGAVVDTRSARGEAAKTIIGPDGKTQSVSPVERPGYQPRANIERRKTFTDADLEAHGITVGKDANGNPTYSVPGPDGKPQVFGSPSNTERRLSESERRGGQQIAEPDNRPNNTEYHPTFEEAQAAASVKNMIEQDRVISVTRPSTTITPEQTLALKGQVADLVSADNPWMGQTSGIDFNLGNVSTEKDAQAAIEALSHVLRPEIDAARGGAIVTNDQLKAGVADLFHTSENDTDEIISNLLKPDANPNDLPIRLNAGRLVMDKISSDVVKYSSILSDDPENVAVLNILAKHMSNLVRVAQTTKGRISSAARATQSGNITTGELGRAVENAASNMPLGTKVISQADLAAESIQAKFAAAVPYMNPEQLQAFAKKVQLTQGDPGTLLQMLDLVEHSTANEMKVPGFWDKMNTVWVNSVLSGPLTSAKNFLGNTIALAYAPTERYLTGVNLGIRNVISGTPGAGNSAAVRQEGIDLFTGFFTNMRDSFNAAKTAFKSGKPILESGNLTNEIQNPFQGYLGTAVGVPSRTLMSQDEFFKNISYRSFVRSKALREASENGLDEAATMSLVQKRMEDSLVNGIALNNNALAFAQKVTFTNPLTPGTVGASLSSMVNQHPALRFAALPFVKTPTNIILWTWDRTPGIAFALKANREALMAGGERAAEVMARQSTGAMVWGAGLFLAYNGTLTGGGPKDPVQRKLLSDTGWKPYSVKVGKKYIPYQAGDPLLMPFGIMADVMQASGELDENHQNNFAMAFTTSLSRNLASKSYLYGLTDFMQAAFDGDTTVLDKWVKTRVGSFVPAVLNQTNPDNDVRELRDYTDQVLGHIPGLSETLPPRVSFFGQPIMKAPFSSGRPVNPFTPSIAQDDTSVEDKLLELGRDFAYPSKKYPGTDVDMTSHEFGLAKGNLTPYDRMLQIMASPGNGVPTLRTTLGHITSSPAWDKMSPGVPGIQEGGTRFEKINEQVQKYREIAMKKLMLEFPALQEAVQRSKITKKVAEKGGQQAVDNIQSYLNEPK